MVDPPKMADNEATLPAKGPEPMSANALDIEGEREGRILTAEPQRLGRPEIDGLVELRGRWRPFDWFRRAATRNIGEITSDLSFPSTACRGPAVAAAPVLVQSGTTAT